MYEAFSVILSALFLGIIVGLIVSLTLTAQFYLFIELPFKLAVRLLFNSIVSYSTVLNNGDYVYCDNIFCCFDPCKRY